MSNTAIRLNHNLDSPKFMWLWAKYVKAFNPKYHCTNSLAGRYSSKFSGKKHPDLIKKNNILMDEFEDSKAIYICGVAKKGYSVKKNYPHNLHLAIKPSPGKSFEFKFENWELNVENGTLLDIPAEDELDNKYKKLPPEYTTCRIFRWAASSPLLDPVN
jgi:hypothetical protein